MALGTATVVKKVAGDGPLRADVLSFAGDGAYSAGGTGGFEAYVQAALGVGLVDIVALVPQSCGGFHLTYEQDTDKLKVWNFNYDASDGPMQEDTTANQSGRTYVVLVISH
jgi:hypothetical protein